MSKVPVAIVILNHRQDERLTDCLNSCSFAEEIIVLDYESGVDWKNWTEKFPLTVIPKKDMLRDFGQARQEGLLLAEHDWVLFLDSDEVLEKEANEEIQRCVSQDQVNGFWVRRRDVFLGREMKYGEVGEAWLLRLMKRTEARFERPVHEVTTINGATAYSEIVIRHFAHQSISEFLAKVSLYARMEAQFRPNYSTAQLVFELLFFPTGKFIFNFLLKLGLLDGWRGLIYAVMMSVHSLLVRIFAYEKQVRS